MLLASVGEVAGIVVAAVVFLTVLAGIALKLVLTVVTEYQRAVFFRFGRIRASAKGPGVIVRVPLMDRVVKVNLRVEVVDIPPQAAITKDNVTIQVDAVVYFRVVDPVKAVIGVDNFKLASQRIAMTSLRSIIGRHELDNLLAHRDDINNELRATIALSTQGFGVEVHDVQIRDITLPPELLRAMARQAEAERERRAKVISARGELEASKELSAAAAQLASAPGSLQLRTLQTLTEVAAERNSTLIFPIPVELLSFLRNAGGNAGTLDPEPRAPIGGTELDAAHLEPGIAAPLIALAGEIAGAARSPEAKTGEDEAVADGPVEDEAAAEGAAAGAEGQDVGTDSTGGAAVG
jgi:regulator of protease activity HflC (stomatin/prohibitin superfamily)